MILVSRPIFQLRWVALFALVLWALGITSAMSYELVMDLATAFDSEIERFKEVSNGSTLLSEFLYRLSGPREFIFGQWFGQQDGMLVFAAIIPVLGLGRALANRTFAYDLLFPLTRVQIGIRYLVPSFLLLLGGYLLACLAVWALAFGQGIDLPEFWLHSLAGATILAALHGLGSLCTLLTKGQFGAGALSVVVILALSIIAMIPGLAAISPLGSFHGLARSEASMVNMLGWVVMAAVLHAGALHLLSRREV